MKQIEKVIEVWHLDDYVKCPNYAKYNWSNKQIRKNHYLYEPLRSLLMSCYKDLSNLEKIVRWVTVRGRLHNALAPLLDSSIPLEKYKNISLNCLAQLRNWYIDTFRDGPTTCLHNLWLETRVPVTGVTIAGRIDAILVSPEFVRIVEITNSIKSSSEIFSSLSLRSKIWMLHQQGIKVDEVLIIRIIPTGINTDTFKVRDYNDFIYKTERAVQWATGSLKNQIYHPSITEMCSACPYKKVCSW